MTHSERRMAIAAEHAPEQHSRRRWLSLALLCTAQAVGVLNFQIVTLGLPLIQENLGFSAANLQWVVTANAVTFGGLLLLAGRAADLYGHRRLFMIGFGIFALASLGCGLATSPLILIIARAFQGLGTAIITPAAMALLTDTFKDGADRNRALGIWGAAGAIGGVVSAVLGGALVTGLGWRWIFFLSVPIAILPLVLAPLLLVEQRDHSGAKRLDVLGAITGTADVLVLVVGLTHAAQVGFSSPRTWGLLILALILTLLFRVVEVKAERPLVPLRIFRRRIITGANLVTFILAAVANTPIYFFTLYMQQIQGYSPIATGLAFLPTNLAMIAGSPIGTRLVNMIGARRTQIVGMGTLIAGLLVFASVSVQTSYLSTLLPALILLGLGLGVTQVAAAIAGVHLVAPTLRGLASGLLGTSVQIGTTVGLALLVTVSTTRTNMVQGSAQSSPESLVAGFQAAFLAGAVLAFFGMLIAFLLIHRPRLGLEEPVDARASEGGQ